MIKKVNKFLNKYWDTMLMILATISAMTYMALGNDLRALVYIVLLFGLGMQKSIEELVTWLKTLCRLLYWMEKDKDGDMNG